jgi:SSS family solute:Na+ symporter
MIIISLIKPKKEGESEIEVDSKMFRISGAFAVGVLLLFGVLAALYTAFW